MSEHPIQGLMDTAMSNIKAMVDVNTIVGDAVTAPDGTLIIPVSTVSFGFGAGGSEFSPKQQTGADSLFGGGCGGGAKVKPIAFLIVNNGNVRLMPVSGESSPVDKLIDLVPDLLDKMNGAISGAAKKFCDKKDKKADKKEEKKNAGGDDDMVDVVAP